MQGLASLRLLAAFAFCYFFPANAAVTPDLQRVIRANTFEVVMKKPEKDPVTYEKPLPLDLMPYTERTDAYRSVGTAFSLGNNMYVTAAHVLLEAIGSQFGGPALRSSAGEVQPIGQIIRFSAHEDFVVFSVNTSPSASGFQVNRDPKIDDAVLAVGNALGEGIVIRDGLFTSQTPEDQDGRWKWIRFSAAASPGNSGGPLLDSQGNVIGIVIGKSPNENLNYSLPIARVLDAEPFKAKFDQRVLAGLPFLRGTDSYTYKDEFRLPLDWPAFSKQFKALVSRHADEARSSLLQKFADTEFPNGPGSDTLLYDPNANEYQIRLISQQEDGSWSAPQLRFSSTDLTGDGFVRQASANGTILLRVTWPNAASDDSLYSDSKHFMDLALKALNFSRPVGPDKVKITSLGAAQSDVVHVDVYGRKWQERVWAVPFMDAYIIGLMLPTPDGYAAILQLSNSPALPEALQLMRLLAGQADVSYSGTIAQWRAYLRRRSLLPANLADVTLDGGPPFELHTHRFVSKVRPTEIALTEKSPLGLTMGFSKQGSRLVCDVQEIWWYRDERRQRAIGLWRRERPPSTAPMELRNRFSSMREHRAPYDGELTRESADIYTSSSILDVAGRKSGSIAADLLYGITVQFDRYPSGNDSVGTPRDVASNTHILEPGLGEDLPETKAEFSSVGSSNRQLVGVVIPPVTIPQSVDVPINSNEVAAAGQYAASNSLLPEMHSADYYGKDFRGRLITDDYAKFLAIQNTGQNHGFAGAASASIVDALRNYWSQFPALTHNRDMWVDFLSRNKLPATTPHQPDVMTLEKQLTEALDSPTPNPQWAKLANDLRIAYINERSQLIKSMASNGTLARGQMRPRITPCPAAATSTSGTPRPKLNHVNGNLEEFWPPESRRLGEEGVIYVTLHISMAGCVTSSATLGSSGSQMIDDAVAKFVEVIEFFPGEKDGKAIETDARMPFTLKLAQ